MKQVAALVTEIVLKSDIKPWVERRCAAAGAEVEWHNVTQSTATYKEVFKNSPNVITWQCRMPHSWTSNWGNNVLHIENSLLCQRAGAFVDSRGFFSQSNLRVANNWAIEHSVDLDAFAQKHFGWKAFSGGNPDGPVLVTLQCRKDCNINFEYPASPRGDKVVFTLNTVLDHLPKDRGVLLRPHPRERDSFIDLPTVEGCQWSMDGDFASLLPQCSALVTVNSTCASEACLLGIPVAVLGTGAFTGSGAVYDCHQDLSRLSAFLEYQNDVEAQRRYCAAILGRHFLPYKHETEVSCPEFDLWLARLR